MVHFRSLEKRSLLVSSRVIDMSEDIKSRIAFRYATSEDIENIVALEPLIFTDPWSEEMIRADIEARIAKYLVAEICDSNDESREGTLIDIYANNYDVNNPNTVKPRIIGYLGYWLVMDECSINNVGVLPDYRLQGIGSMLLENAIKDTKNFGARTWVLEVRAGNESAIALYKKYGFTPAGRRKRYYEDSEDAITMIRYNKDILVLAIESSCDETAAAVVRNGREVLSNIISSQISIHAEYGGVVPEIASRHHLTNVNGVIERALVEADVTLDDVDLIAVTNGPGLIGALVIGVAAAKGLSLVTQKPIIGVNHMYGHISSNYISYPELEPPFVCLVVSGGHTSLVRMEGYTKASFLGSTRDDAVGEAFDKVARVLGLGYPGGPKIESAAKCGNPDAIYFKRVYLEKGSFDFSFSGIKTAVLNYVNSERQKGLYPRTEDVAHAFQEAVVEVLVEKAVSAVKNLNESKLVLAGGVAANGRLREELQKRCEEENIQLYLPEKNLCTDNAAMIGSAAYYKCIEKGADNLSLDAYADIDW